MEYEQGTLPAPWIDLYAADLMRLLREDDTAAERIRLINDSDAAGIQPLEVNSHD